MSVIQTIVEMEQRLADQFLSHRLSISRSNSFSQIELRSIDRPGFALSVSPYTTSHVSAVNSTLALRNKRTSRITSKVSPPLIIALERPLLKLAFFHDSSPNGNIKYLNMLFVSDEEEAMISLATFAPDKIEKLNYRKIP